MNMQTLNTLLAPSLGERAAGHWQRFIAEQAEHAESFPQNDAHAAPGDELKAERYLAWLFDQKLIQFADLERVLTLSPIVTGSFPEAKDRPLGYDFLRPLGQGAMGVVHLAKDLSLRRKVAYKQLLGQATMPVLRRFLNEIRITAQLEHPSIVPVYQLSTEPGELPLLSYSMKLVHGQTLKERLASVRAALDAGLEPEDSLRDLLEIFLSVCDAMAYAHSRKVIHRDLKPANLMTGPYGDVYVMDWGIARCFGASDLPVDEPVSGEPVPVPVSGLSSDDTLDQTQMGQILGTPRYMSPQQAAGKNAELDGRSDQFALGLILFEILALKQALTGANQLELLKSVLKAELLPLTPYQPKRLIPAELKAIVSKATRRKPADRYPDVADMARDIRRYLNGQSVSVYQEPLLPSLLRWLRQHRQATLYSILGLSLGSLAILAGSLVWQLWRTDVDSRREAALSRFLSLASGRAQLIDASFLEYQGQLEALASATRQLLLQAHIPDPLNDNFQPQDLTLDPAYGRAISLTRPSVLSLDGTISKSAISQVQPLQALTQQFRSLIKPNQPLSWASVQLDSGAGLRFPGTALAKPDPRQMQFYRQAASQQAPLWGRPYQDSTPLGLLLPVLAPLRTPQGHLLGVASLELSLDKLLPELLKLPEQPGIHNIALLDPDGRALVTLGNQPTDTLRPATEQTQLVDVTELTRQANGVVKQPNGRLLAFFRLGSLGWYYLVELTEPA